MESQQAVEQLSGLAHGGRLAIFRLLVQATAPLPAGEIAQLLEIPASTLSFHLKNLHQAGLIVSEQQGRFVRYQANRQAFQGLIDYLTDNCCGGQGCPA